MQKIMVVDDEEKALENIASCLEREGFAVATFTSAVHALRTIDVASSDIDLIITDIRMPSVDGTELLKAAQACKHPIPVIVLTGFGDVDTAVNIMKAGAADFLCKPISGKELVVRIRKVLEKEDLAEEVESLRKKIEAEESFRSIVGKSKRMHEVFDLVGSVADTDCTVLVRGETGTGKELVARAIHEASRRKDEPFVALSCTSIQQTLLESELFGHEKGAFTGAHAVKIGKLESAGAGTVLLDEIGDTSPEIQAKLLRVLQEREFERVGGLKTIKLNARVIAATNRNLEGAVKDGLFREDLYYRLNVVEVKLPPLREREEDVIVLAEHFLNLFKKRYERGIEGYAPSAIQQLIEYPWPGNVRELKNTIERTVLTNPRKWIDRLSGLESASKGMNGSFKAMPLKMTYLDAKEVVSQELEKAFLVQYMKQERGQINRVAELMGISTRTVSRQLEKYGLDKMDFRDKKEGERAPT